MSLLCPEPLMVSRLRVRTKCLQRATRCHLTSHRVSGPICYAPLAPAAAVTGLLSAPGASQVCFGHSHLLREALPDYLFKMIISAPL